MKVLLRSEGKFYSETWTKPLYWTVMLRVKRESKSTSRSKRRTKEINMWWSEPIRIHQRERESWPRSKQCVVKSTASRKFPLYISLPIYLIYMGRVLRWGGERGISQSLHDTCGEGNGTPLQCSCLENPMDGGAWWAAVHGVAKSQTRLSDFTFTFHFHALEKEMATHYSVLAWRIPGTVDPGGLPSMGSHRVKHYESNLAAAAAWYLGFWLLNP